MFGKHIDNRRRNVESLAFKPLATEIVVLVRRKTNESFHVTHDAFGIGRDSLEWYEMDTALGEN